VTVRRLAAVVFIFVGSALAWAVLGSSVVARTGQFDSQLEQEVALLWGGTHRQVAPTAWILRPATDTETVETKEPDGRVTRRDVTKSVLRQVAAPLEQTRATVTLDLEQRRKGLLWYPTYTVGFQAAYRFINPDAEPRALHLRFPLPAAHALFDDLVFTIDGREIRPTSDVSKEMAADVVAAAGAAVALDVRYRSRGMRTWTYAFAEEGASQVRDFTLTMRTDFAAIDFPAGTVSPTAATPRADGAEIVWTFTNLISGQAIGMECPTPLNPGPFAARVTFFAPVSLLFFLTVMVIVGATDGAPLHPMHYWFIAAAFFAFHLLLAYLVDHLNVHVAFAASAAVSLALVVSYLRAVAGMRRTLAIAAAAQAVFLVLFSYAFFFEGFTGLTITIGAIVTLFMLMQMTAKVSWDEVFAPRPVEAIGGGHAGRH
jgi:inner membrane protein involved in colicin E2 resistance